MGFRVELLAGALSELIRVEMSELAPPRICLVESTTLGQRRSLTACETPL